MYEMEGPAWRSAAAASDCSAAALPQRLPTGSEDPLECRSPGLLRFPWVSPEVVLVFVVKTVLLPLPRAAQGLSIHLFKILF
jgi:hypothetical protein